MKNHLTMNSEKKKENCVHSLPSVEVNICSVYTLHQTGPLRTLCCWILAGNVKTDLLCSRLSSLPWCIYKIRHSGTYLGTPRYYWTERWANVKLSVVTRCEQMWRCFQHWDMSCAIKIAVMIDIVSFPCLNVCHVKWTRRFHWSSYNLDSFAREQL